MRTFPLLLALMLLGGCISGEDAQPAATLVPERPSIHEEETKAFEGHATAMPGAEVQSAVFEADFERFAQRTIIRYELSNAPTMTSYTLVISANGKIIRDRFQSVLEEQIIVEDVSAPYHIEFRPMRLETGFDVHIEITQKYEWLNATDRAAGEAALQERVRRASISDNETRWFNGTTPPTIQGTPMGDGDTEWTTSFDRAPSWVVIEAEWMGGPPSSTPWVRVYAGPNEELIHDKPLERGHFAAHYGSRPSELLSGPYRIVLDVGTTAGYPWRAAVTQFYEEFPSQSFHLLGRD